MTVVGESAKAKHGVLSRTMDEYLSQTETAEYLGVSIRRLQQMRSSGEISAEVSGTRRVRYSLTEVRRVKALRETFRPSR